MNKPFIIAHRGASALAPENTFAAFRRAIADDAEISIDFDQVGSTVAGTGVKVWIIGHR